MFFGSEPAVAMAQIAIDATASDVVVRVVGVGEGEAFERTEVGLDQVEPRGFGRGPHRADAKPLEQREEARMAAYERYYKRFNKTYHVQLQVESIVLKGKSLPNVSPLVDANFVAEVETLVLTAGHDVARLRGAIAIDVSQEGDRIAQMQGGTKAIRPGDMMMRDANGVCCSILYGQDNRSPISCATSHVLYVAYVPVGVPTEAVEAQLGKIKANVRLFSPEVTVEQHRLLSA